MPNTNGVNAVGVWLISCIIMVFGALSEYGVILYLMLKTFGNQPNSTNVRSVDILGDDEGCRYSTLENTKHKPKIATISIDSIKRNGIDEQSFLKEVDKKSKVDIAFQNDKLRQIDSMALMIFPIVFFLFIVGYSVFLSV